MVQPEGWFKGDVANLDSVDIEGPLAAAKTPCCQYYTSAYSNAARAAKEKGDEAASDLYSFLAAITSFAPRFETGRQPYEPLFQIGDRRGLTPADLVAQDLDVIREIITRLKDPSLRARLLDVLWVGAKDYRAAGDAVNAYLQAGQRLDDAENWTHAVVCFHRALYLAAALGKSASFDEAAQVVLGCARRAATEPRGFFGCKIMELTLRFGIGDAAEFAPLAEAIACQAESTNEWRRARHYWRVAGDWWKLGKNSDGQAGARRAAAETYVSEAEGRLVGADRSGIVARAATLKGDRGASQDGRGTGPD
jgi:hypothetical protein